jgi:hypothetical protein
MEEENVPGLGAHDTDSLQILSGKGLKNEKCKFSNILNDAHSKLFLCPLQRGRRPTLRKFGAIEQTRVRPFVLR